MITITDLVHWIKLIVAVVGERSSYEIDVEYRQVEPHIIVTSVEVTCCTFGSWSTSCQAAFEADFDGMDCAGLGWNKDERDGVDCRW